MREILLVSLHFPSLIPLVYSFIPSFFLPFFVFFPHTQLNQENPIQLKSYKLARSSKGLSERNLKPEIHERRLIAVSSRAAFPRLTRNSLAPSVLTSPLHSLCRKSSTGLGELRRSIWQIGNCCGASASVSSVC